ncbi:MULTISPECIES: AAA family ATPase [Proteiniphilum]|jgi:predicted ATPase|uniref:AAA family ATPase n=1 Tax=Proteiniphilum TaxID=294702 RepID=UPI000367FC03|nr:MULTISPECIES: AAA family ATPase [Proteiniphilum]
MITYIEINGFKSFHNFEMEFTPLTIIAGTNASGKSNLFDALMLLSSLAETDNIKKAFREQRGEFIELFSQYGENNYAQEMNFSVEMLVNKNITDAWGNKKMLKYTRLRYELSVRRFTNEVGMEDIEVSHEHLVNLKHQNDKWIKIIPSEYRELWRPKVITGKRGIPYIDTTVENNIPTVIVPQDGTTGNKRRFPLKNATRTVLSSFDTIDFPHVLAAKEEMKSWRFLQLNPEDLRKPTDKSNGEDFITQSGKNLAAALNRITLKNEYSLGEISRKLQSFVPNFIEVKVIDDKENKQFIIKLIDKDNKEYSSRVLSEGTLRILALCILEQDEQFTGLLCFEEPENGIHPFRVNTMAALLKDLTNDFTDDELPLRQVIVNTHSPILVSNAYKWETDNNVSIWYAELINRIADINRERMNISITSILPVVKEQDFQLSLPWTEIQKKMTLTTVKEYLETKENLQ